VDVSYWLRETGVMGEIGDDGGYSGKIEECTNFKRLIACEDWQYLHWDIPNEPYRKITGNGALDGEYGTLEAIVFKAVPDSPETVIEIFVDDFYQGPPQNPAMPTMFVDSIFVRHANLAKGFKGGKAEVTIKDSLGNPVSGATVTGTFSGEFNETLSGITDSKGIATIFTTQSDKGGGVIFTFCVDDVEREYSRIYDPGANQETCDTYVSE